MNNEELIENLKKEIECLKAIQAIQNCMGHYETLHFCGTEVGRTGKECFALWRDDVTVEVSMDGGVFGSKAVDEYWSRSSGKVGGGNLVFMHTLATPIIEVAGNGKTAKAIWCSPGLEAGITRRGDLNVWCWGKYGTDFIKNPETGEWRIWHMKWFRITRNDYNKNFTEFAAIEDEQIRNPKSHPSMAENLPVFPLVFHQPLSIDPSKQSHPFPYTPKPYQDYDGDFRWIYGSVERENLFGVKYNDLEKYYNKNYPERI